MTKIAVISDIHANIDALNLVLRDIEKRNVDKIICLGDLVTKYFYPSEVVEAVRKNADLVLKGNCDNLVANNEKYKFARGKLGLEKIEYLENLPTKEQLKINNVLVNLYHSTPDNLEAMFNPVFNDNEHTRYKDSTIYDYNKMFTSSNPEVSFVGHTHQNYIGIENNNKLNIVDQDNVNLTDKNRAIINVGSAGENSKLIKKDNEYKPNINPYLTYVIIDDAKLKNGVNVSMIKVPYKETLKKVYYNMVDLQKQNLAPQSPIDTEKVRESLLNMGYSDEELTRGGKMIK